MMEFFTSVTGIVILLGIVVLALMSFRLVPSIFKKDSIKKAMQIAVSIIVLASALYVILSQKYTPDVQKWAFGAVGLVVGYWLPS